MQTTGLQLACTLNASTHAELEQELDAIRERAYQAFGTSPPANGASTPARSVRGQTRPMRQRPARTSTRRPARATTAGNGRVSDKQLHDTLTALNGATSIKLAKECGISPNTALRKLHKLEKDGSIYREGERANTRWYARQPVAA